MNGTIDLEGVRAARAALAAIVRDHPELTQPAARERLAAALPEIIAMKRLDPNTGASTTVGVRLAPDLLAAVDREMERLKALVPGSSIGRSDAVRSLVLRAVGLAPSTPAAVTESPAVAVPAPAATITPPAPELRAALAPVPSTRVLALTSPDTVDLAKLKRRLDAAIKAGHSGRAIASKAGINEGTLRHWRSGKNNTIGDDIARKVVAALDAQGTP